MGTDRKRKFENNEETNESHDESDHESPIRDNASEEENEGDQDSSSSHSSADEENHSNSHSESDREKNESGDEGDDETSEREEESDEENDDYQDKPYYHSSVDHDLYWEAEQERAAQWENDDPEYDTDNPNPDDYEGPEYSTREILTALRDSDPEEEIDIDHIMRYAADPSELRNELIRDFRNGDERNLAVIEHIIDQDEKCSDDDFLEEQLEEAIENGDEEKAEFYSEYLNREGAGVKEAIENNSSVMLKKLNAVIDRDAISYAIELDKKEALSYYLEEDFETTSQFILKAIVSELNKELLTFLIEMGGLDKAYELIKYLYDHKSMPLVHVFFDIFLLEDLLQEINEQDDEEQLIYNDVLKWLKFYLPESDKSYADVHQLVLSIPAKLEITKKLLFYPNESFNGAPILSELRETLDKDLEGEEKRAALNLVGMPACTVKYFLGHSPYHQPSEEKAERYSRSSNHPLPIAIHQKDARAPLSDIHTERKINTGKGNAAHLGLFANQLQGINQYKKVTLPNEIVERKSDISNGSLYDQLLHYRLETCKFIVENAKTTPTAPIRIGFYNDYPCVMVFINTPKTAPKRVSEAALKDFVRLMMSYFIPLVNYVAQVSGLGHIELTRRPGFGFLTPTLANCGQSFRINVGIIPTAYAKILSDCLLRLNKVLLQLENIDTLDTSLPSPNFLTTKEYKAYLESAKEKRSLPNPKNILDMLWCKVDKANQTTVTNLMRRRAVRFAFSAQIYADLSQSKGNAKTDARLFLDALKASLQKGKINKETLQFEPHRDSCFLPLKVAAVKIEDAKFFNICALIMQKFQKALSASKPPQLLKKREKECLAALDTCIKNKTLDQFYFNLEMLNELIYTHTLATTPSVKLDEYGSDSEVEVESEEKINIYGEKIIFPNGMKAILKAVDAGAKHLFHHYPKLSNKSQKYPISLYKMYYEAEKALKLLKLFKISKKCDSELVLYDINACVTDGKNSQILTPSEMANVKVFIADSTSATLDKYRHWLTIFKQQSKMDILFFVSSGLKMEQLGADKNHYGTIRVFTKDKALLKKIVHQIKQGSKEGVKANIAHHYRHMMKRLDAVPSNATILQDANETQKTVQSARSSSSLTSQEYKQKVSLFSRNEPSTVKSTSKLSSLGLGKK